MMVRKDMGAYDEYAHNRFLAELTFLLHGTSTAVLPWACLEDPERKAPSWEALEAQPSQTSASVASDDFSDATSINYDDAASCTILSEQTQSTFEDTKSKEREGVELDEDNQRNTWPDTARLKTCVDPAEIVFPVRSRIASEYEREENVLLAMQSLWPADSEPDDDKPDDDHGREFKTVASPLERLFDGRSKKE